MSTTLQRESWFPERSLWIPLTVVLVVGLTGKWPLAVGLTVMFLAHLARPFDFLLAFLILVTGASFVANSGGGLTYQLSLLTCAILLVFACYVIHHSNRVFSITKSPLTVPLAVFVLLTVANAARGVLIGNFLRNLGLELIAGLALASAFLVANAFDPKRDLRIAMIGLILIAYASAIWGFRSFALEHTRTAVAYTVALPGIIGIMLINFALRAPTSWSALGWVTLSLPLFLHQLITFGRGLWTGCFASLLLSAFLFGGVKGRPAHRWGRVGMVVLMLAGFGLFGGLQLAVFFGQGDLLQEAAIRLASIGSTKEGYETRSTMIRFFEYATVIPLIRESPWIGHGLGFTFPVKEPFSGKTADQWGVHQNYLLVLLKQGVLGLVLFGWMLWSAIRLGIREAKKRRDPWEATWFASTAGATVFLAVFSLSNYPFAVVNETFLLALFWGGSMAMTRTGFIGLRWTPVRAALEVVRPGRVERVTPDEGGAD